jgi:hypothetical protein
VSDLRREFETLASAFAAREGRHDPSSACPPAEQLFEAASGALDREQRLKIVDHLSQCAECTQDWRLALELGARPMSPVVKPGRARVAGFAMAASAVLAIGLTVYFVKQGPEEAPQYRDAGQRRAPVSRTGCRVPAPCFDGLQGRKALSTQSV